MKKATEASEDILAAVVRNAIALEGARQAAMEELAKALREMIECAKREGWDNGGDRKVWALGQAEEALDHAKLFLKEKS